MNRASYRFFTLLTFLGLCLSVNHSIALPDDRDQPINVSADKAYKNGNKGTTVYEGSVVIVQGSIRISGDKVSIFDNDGTVNKIIAQGAPAKFKQKPDALSGDIIADGSTIEYDVEKESLLLLEDALLKQDGRTTNSNKITYDLKTAIVNAGDNTGRVIMVLEPTKPAKQ